MLGEEDHRDLPAKEWHSHTETALYRVASCAGRARVTSEGQSGAVAHRVEHARGARQPRLAAALAAKPRQRLARDGVVQLEPHPRAALPHRVLGAHLRPTRGGMADPLLGGGAYYPTVTCRLAHARSGPGDCGYIRAPAATPRC